MRKNDKKTFKILRIAAALAVGLGLFSMNLNVAIGDDTEIFTQPPGMTPPAPNVMIYIDSSANWNEDKQGWVQNTLYCPTSLPNAQQNACRKQGAAELMQLYNVLNDLSGKNINVGLMIATKSSGTGKPGGFVRIGARSLTSTTNVTAMRAIVQDIFDGTFGDGSGSNDQVPPSNIDYSNVMYEMYNYFSGLTPHSGVVGDLANLRDYTGNATTYSPPTYGLTTNNALSSSSSSAHYNTPISATVPCAKNYIIFIGNGLPNQDAEASGAAKISALGGDSQVIPITTYSTAQAIWMDEWSRFLYQKGVQVTPVTNPDGTVTTPSGKVVTYTIDVYKDKQDLNQTALFKSAARVGGGKYFAGRSDAEIKAALLAIFDDIQAVNTVFASVSLPVSVNVRGTNLNQVYLGVFRPDADGNPVWPGNIKEYKLGVGSNGDLKMVDKNGADAVSAATGFIDKQANSFWTSSNSYWSYAGGADPDAYNLTSDAPDGPLVERGGVSMKIRGTDSSSSATLASTRKVLTYVGSSSSVPAYTPATSGSAASGGQALLNSGTTKFDTANTSIVDTSLGLASGDTTGRANIINWIRGQDLDDLNSNGLTTDLRPRVHGDVVHSRPAVVNYNRYSDDDDVYVFYGANDGLLHAVRGGQGIISRTSSIAGQESWAFAAPEHYSGFSRLSNNAPAVGYGSSATTTTVSATGTLLGATVYIPTANPGITLGMTVSGGGFSGSPTVTSVNSYPTATLSAGATSSASGTLTFASQLVGASSSATLTSVNSTTATLTWQGATSQTPAWVANNSSSLIGVPLSGTGLPTGATFQGISETGGTAVNPGITMSANATGTTTGATLETHLTQSLPNAVWTGSDTNIWFAPGTTLPTTWLGAGDAIYNMSGTKLGGAGATVSSTGAGASIDLTTAPAASAIISNLAISTPTVTGALSCTGTNNATSFTCVNNTGATITWGSSLSVKTPSGGAKVSSGWAVTTASTSTPNTGSVIFTLVSNTVSGNFSSKDVTFNNTLTQSGIMGILFAGNKTITLPNGALSGLVANTSYVSGGTGLTTGSTNKVTVVSATSGVKAVMSALVSSGGTFQNVQAVDSTSQASYTANLVSGNSFARVTSPASPSFSSVTTGAIITGASAALRGDIPFPTLVSSTALAGTSPYVTTVTIGIPSGTVTNSTGNDYNFSIGLTGTAYTGFSKTPITDAAYPSYASAMNSLLSAATSTGGPGVSVTGTGIASGTTLTSISNGTSDTFVVASSSTATTGNASLTFSTSSATVSALPKPYFFDGSITIWQKDANGDGKLTHGTGSGDQVWMFATMRRGGRMIYAFDITAPDNPILMWKKGCTAQTGTTSCDAGFEEMGQTWSDPKVNVFNIGGTATPVLTFGAGYDAGVDDVDPLAAANVKGRGLYFVNAASGAVIRYFGPAASNNTGLGAAFKQVADMTYSMPSGATILNKDRTTGITQNVYRVYIPDTGGQIWRIDTSSTDPTRWVVNKVATVGKHWYSTHGKTTYSGILLANDICSANPCAGNDLARQSRKFLFDVDVVFGGNDGQPFDYLLIGSGDREHPFNGYGDTDHPTATGHINRFYMIKDYDVASNYAYATDGTCTSTGAICSRWNSVSNTVVAATNETDLYDATRNQLQQKLACTGTCSFSITATTFTASKGWFITMEAGEKTTGSSTTSAGFVYFGTNLSSLATQSTNSCSAKLGIARMYAVGIDDARALIQGTITPNISESSAMAARYTTLVAGGFPPTPVPVAVIIDGKRYEGVLSGTEVKTPDNSVTGQRLGVYSKKRIDR